MWVYAGIDEAGYGPFFGPLTVGRCVLAIPALSADGRDPTPAPGPGGWPGFPGGRVPDLWRRLSKAVCRSVSGSRGRIPINDSKKLTSKAAGVKHLERGVLSFASLMRMQPADAASLLDALGETSHRADSLPPWYTADAASPWQPLPEALDPGELAVCRGLLANTAHRIGLTTADLGVCCVFEDRFNRMVQATRSKAAVSFTFVAEHLRAVWVKFGEHGPVVVVDRQSGRTRYREQLALAFQDAEVDVLQESPQRSVYALRGLGGPTPHRREMTVYFQTEADGSHMPVALASMVAKYTRELMMHRFQRWFTQRCPGVGPTAGYGTDAKRFQREITPHLAALGLDLRQLRRRA